MTSLSQRLGWVCQLCIISAGFPLYAQSPVELQPLVIETDAMPDVQPKHTLQERELRVQIAETLGVTLQRELGVNNLSYGPGVGQPVIRGFSGPRVRIMNNGMGMHDLTSLSPDLAVAFDPLLADSITVLKGPATLRYGGNAMGGMVDIKHHRIPEAIPVNGVSGRLGFNYDHNNSGKSGMFALDAGKGIWAIHGDYFKRDANNTHIPGYALDEQAILEQFQVEPESNSFGVIENTSTNSEGGSVGIAMIGNSGRLGMSYHKMRRDYGIPPGVPGHSDNDDADQEAIRIDMSQQRYDVEGVYYSDWSWLSELEFKLSYIDYAHEDYDASADDRDATLTQFSNQVWESRLELTHHITDWIEGITGVQWQSREFTASGVETYTPSTDVDSVAWFINETLFMTETLNLEIGGRIEYQSTRPQTRELQVPGVSGILTLPDELDFLTYALAASLNYQVLPQTDLYVSWQLSQRAPDIQELLAFGPNFAIRSFTIGRLDLDPELTHHFELGINYDASFIEINANGYYKNVDNFIYLQNTGIFFNLAPDPPRFQLACADLSNCLPVFAYEADKAHFAGYEAEITFRSENPLPVQPYVSLFSDYVRGWFDDQSLGDVPRMPPLRFGFEIGATWQSWQSRLRFTHALEQDHPGNLETATPDYQRLDLDISYDWLYDNERNLLLFARFSNITDQEIRNSTSFLRNFAPEAGFSTVIGMNLTF